MVGNALCLAYLFPALWQQLFSCAAWPNAGSKVCTAVRNEVSLARGRLLHQVEQGKGQLVPCGCIPVLFYDC